MEGEVVVRDVAEVEWAFVERVFGTRGDPAGCWCQFFKLSRTEWRDTNRKHCRSELERQVRLRPSPGLVAFLDDEPVGWVAVEPRVNYPTALAGRVVSTSSEYETSDESVWAVTCFVVRVGYRRRGLGARLMAAAVEHARGAGARVLEGYPVDVAAKEKVSSAELYHGTLSLFEGAGFRVVARPSPGRALTSLIL